MIVVMFGLMFVLLCVAVLNLLYLYRRNSTALWDDHILDRVHEAYKKLEEKKNKEQKK